MRLPWLTAGLVALCATASLVPGGAEALQYDRARVAAGEVWLLLTGQMVHWSARMTAADLGMLLALGAWLEIQGERKRLARALVLGAGLSALAVHALSPDLSLYRGASGMASALFVLAALRIGEDTGEAPRFLAWLAVALFLGKDAWEAVTGQTLFAGQLPDGVEVVPLVHLLGGLAGLVSILGATPALSVDGRRAAQDPPGFRRSSLRGLAGHGAAPQGLDPQQSQ